MHHCLVVLDHDQGVSLVAEVVHDFCQAVDVPVVKSDGGFIEDKKGLGESRAEAGSEIDTGNFSAREGSRGSVQSEVAEADLAEIVKARGDFVKNQAGGLVERSV